MKDKKEVYNGICSEQNALYERAKKFIIDSINENGGCIELDYQQYSCLEDFEFPIRAILYGRHENISIDITKIYLADGTSEVILADGFDSGNNELMKCFHIADHQYIFLVWFIGSVLKLDKK